MTEADVDAIIAGYNWKLIPPHMHMAVKNWVKYGRPGGGFLSAMMEHNVYDAIGRADLENQKAIVDWVKFMHNYLPGGCHGSEKTVSEWYRNGGLVGRYVKEDREIEEHTA